MCHHKKKWAQNNWPVATGCAGGCDNSKPIAEEKREKKKKEMFGISHSHLISHAGQSHNNKQPKFCIFCFLRGFSRYLRPAPWLTRLMAAGENYLVNLKEFRSDAKSKNLCTGINQLCWRGSISGESVAPEPSSVPAASLRANSLACWRAPYVLIKPQSLRASCPPSVRPRYAGFIVAAGLCRIST